MESELVNTMKDMIARSEQSKSKFLEGTSQFSLLKNRIDALQIGISLLSKWLKTSYTQEQLRKALAPIKSLISKSEKVQTKLKVNTWQHAMIEKHLKALYVVYPLLIESLDEKEN